MKLIDNIFSSIYLFYEAIDDGRPGNKGTSIIGTIFVMTILLTLNVLSFFPAISLRELKWLYYLVVLIACSIMTLNFYWRGRYHRVVKQFLLEKRKGNYFLITVVYIVLSIAVFAITR